jgi:RND family efflux transporter MFP subunit
MKALLRNATPLLCGAVALASFKAACAAPVASAGNEFDCLIEPAQVVEVRSPVVGLLQRVHARRGEAVRQGQVLVTIESSVEQSATETARARAAAEGSVQLARHKVAAAREKARRMAELHDEEFVSAQARDDAAAEARLAEAELKTAEENSQIARLEHRQTQDQLNRRVLYSPFNGVVVDQYLHPGALVDGGEGKKPILKIAQTQPLAVQAILPFRFFPQVKVGTPVVVLPEKPFSGEIAARIATVDRVIDSAAGTFGVVVFLPNTKNELPGGIRCKLRLPGLK